MARLQVETLRTYELEELLLPVLLPYEVGHAIYTLSREQFKVSFLGDMGERELPQFWEWASRQTWGASHEALCSVPMPQRGRLLPLMWFCDGCEVHNASEHVVWSWSSLFGTGDVWDTMFIFTSLPSRRMRLKRTQALVHTELCNIIAWQQRIWTDGVFPDVGYYGEPLTGGRA